VHEYAHFLLNRGREKIPVEKRFHWLLISEGLATCLSMTAFPNRKLSDHLLFTNDKLNWCQKNESYLREKYFSRQLTSHECIKLYEQGDPHLDIPPRAGRYLGFRALQRYVNDRTDDEIIDLLQDRNKALALEI
jgi:uncharacterized protein YjaZ